MRSSVKWAAALIVLALLAPYRAGALGLGDIKLRSYLNQPLNADIAVTAAPSDLGGAHVSLASPEAFTNAGIDRPDVLTGLNFKLEKGADGKTRIHVGSSTPIKEPFLDFIVQVSWSKGKLLREYTVLLDPPVIVDETAPAMQPAVTGGAAMQPAGAPAPSAAQTPATAAASGAGTSGGQTPAAGSQASEQALSGAGAPVAGASPAAGISPATAVSGAPTAAAGAIPTHSITPRLTKQSYGPTGRTDTLWSIAKAVRPGDAISIQQVMLALVKQNPQAFYGGNVNALKAGYILRLPDMDMMTAVAQADALRQVGHQYHQWLEAKQAGLQPGETSPPGETAHPGGMIARGDQSGAAKPQGRLKLLPADVDHAGSPTAAGANGAAAQTPAGAGTDQQLAAALENSEAQKEENAQLQTRLNELNDQLQSLQRLLSLKDDTLAVLQQKLAQLQGQPGAATLTAPPPAPATPAATSTAGAPGSAAPAAVAAGAAQNRPAVGTPNVASAAPAKAVSPAARPAHLPVPKHPVVKPPVIHPASLWQDPKVLAMGGVGVLLIAALAWVVVRRRQMDSAAFVPAAAGTATAAAGDAAAVPAAAEKDYVPTGGDLLETEVDEIDPLAEADVYMAYRRYQQAEELLKGAIEQEPRRPELRIKLLEVHASAQNAPAFVAAAETFYNEFDGGANPLWDKVVAMGRDVQPDHPLFNGIAPSAQGEGGDLDDLLGAGPADTAMEQPQAETATDDDDGTLGDALLAGLPGGEATPAPEDDADSGVIEYETGLNLNLDRPAARGEAASVTTGNEIDFALDDGSGGQAAGGEAEMHASAGGVEITAQVDEAGMADRAAITADAETGEGPVFDLDLDAVDSDKDLDNFFEGLDSLDADEEAPHDGDGQQDVGTKLDLAKAFIEMGDQDGARDILKEIMDAGDEDQKREAQGLLQTLEAEA